MVLFFSQILIRLIDFSGFILMKAELTESKMDDQLIPFIIEIGKILIYIFGGLMGKIFDVNIAALYRMSVCNYEKESLENLLVLLLYWQFTVGDIVIVGSITERLKKLVLEQKI